MNPYIVYLLDESYIGITRKAPEVRALEHVIQAVTNCATAKDKHIWKRLQDGDFPVVEPLFTSEWPALKATSIDAKNGEKILAGQDEIATSLVFRDVLGYKLLNVQAGTSSGTLSRVVTAPETSANFKAWLKSVDAERAKVISSKTLSFFSNPRTVLLPASQVNTRSLNSVTWDDQETVMIVQLTKEDFVNHPFCGPGTRTLRYIWRNSNVDNVNECHERYVDTYKVTGDMEVGKTYIIHTEKRMAPDDEFTKCWWWGNHAPFDQSYVIEALKARLNRIAWLNKHRPDIKNWDDLVRLKDRTFAQLVALDEDAAEAAPQLLNTNRLINYLKTPN